MLKSSPFKRKTNPTLTTVAAFVFVSKRQKAKGKKARSSVWGQAKVSKLADLEFW